MLNWLGANPEALSAPSPKAPAVDAPYSAPFTTDVPHCCGDPETCDDPCQPARTTTEVRKVSPEIVVAIQAYGDARADNVEAVSQLTNVITMIRASYAAPVADSAMAKDAEPIWCLACGDGITAHDPGICGTCFAMKYRDAAVAKDAERYRHLRECNSGSLVIVQIIGTGDDDQVVLTESDADAAIDAAIAASADKTGE